MTARLNRSIKSSIAKQLQRDTQLILQTKNIIEKEFKVLHNKLMQDFESHPVTRELKAGPSSSNISGTLPKGNLFGFIGFFAESDPVAEIEKLLSKTEIFIKRRSMGTKGFIWTYIHKRADSGRSGAGIQNKRLSGGGRVKIPYIKTLLNNFEKDLLSIQASRVSKSIF
jgi:hypothetical protein